MTDFIGRIRQYLTGRTDEHLRFPKDLRTLPAKRRNIITPSPSQVSLISSKGGPFFEQLPPEIRNQIYLIAFGNRTIHIDLRRDYRDYPFDPVERIHAGSETRLRRLEHPGWCWWSSVCHRRASIEYFYDDCRSGGRDFADCESYASEIPKQCFLGVMGWLLACRRAYTETINLIYNTNTLHLSSVLIVHFAPRLLLSHRLSKIASLELALPLHLVDPQDKVLSSNSGIKNLPSRYKIQWSAFKSITASIPSDFPSLKSLNLSVSTYFRPEFSDASFRAYEEYLLGPLDVLLSRCSPTLRELTLAIPQPLQAGLMSREKANVDSTFSEQKFSHGYPWWRYWRSVYHIDSPGCSDRSGCANGYWVREGQWHVDPRTEDKKQRARELGRSS